MIKILLSFANQIEIKYQRENLYNYYLSLFIYLQI